MKKSAWKWWLLAALALVMVYVWYDAFQMMSPANTPIKLQEQAAVPPSGRKVDSGLAYQAPKVNPFQQPSANQTAAQQQNRPRVPEPPPQLSEVFRLTGILRRDRQSQAVVTFADSSVVLMTGDSLGAWQLLEISDRSVLFGQGKFRDTLWLYEN